MPPVNDNFADAIDLGTTASGSTTGTNVDATVEAGEPDAGSYGDVTVWWKWTCPAGKIAATFRLLGSTNTTTDPGAVLDTVLYAYDPSAGPLITDLVLIDYNDDGPIDYTSELSFAVTPGQLYYIKVDGYSSDMQGDLVLAWETEDAPTPPPPPPPPPVDCGVFLVDINTEYGLGGGFGLVGATLALDGTLWFVADTGFVAYHLFSVPLSNLSALTDWGAYNGFGPPVATSTQLAWIDGSHTDGTIAIIKAPFSNPIAGASTAFADSSGDLHIRSLAVADDGAHVVALVEHGFSGSATDTSKIWRVDLDAGTKVELYTHGSPFGSETDDDLAIVGTNVGLDVTSDGRIWCGTYSGKRFFVLAADGSSHDVFGGDGANQVRIFGARCDAKMIVNDPTFLVTVGGVPEAQYVDALIDHTETVRDCEPFDQDRKSVRPSGLSMGRRPDWKRWVWGEVNQSSFHIELWTARCVGGPAEPFEYPYRWPQFYEQLLSADKGQIEDAVILLDERDTALEDHLAGRCAEGAPFHYPSKWDDIYEALLSKDLARTTQAVGLLEERDRQLEEHLTNRPCHDPDYPNGVTCEFDYPHRWASIYEALLSGDPKQVFPAVSVLDERDHVLEHHLSTRRC